MQYSVSLKAYPIVPVPEGKIEWFKKKYKGMILFEGEDILQVILKMEKMTAMAQNQQN